MESDEENYEINDNTYNSIDKLQEISEEMSNKSSNLMNQLTSLFDSIEDEICDEILSDAEKINDFISYVSNVSKNELEIIKTRSKISIKKADKRKDKIIYLKGEIDSLREEVENAEHEKQQLILKIDSISSELIDIYQENQRIETKAKIELMNKKNEQMIEEKYIHQIDNMQNDLDNLKRKNEYYEEGIIKFKRKSMFLEQNNKKLKDELGTKNFQFLMKIKEGDELQNKINILNEQNKDLYKKLKFYQSQIEKWKEKCKNLEDKMNRESPKKKAITKNLKEDSNKKQINKRKSSKKIINNINTQIDDKNEDKNDSENENLRYNTFSNLNDLLGDEASEDSINIKNNNNFLNNNINKVSSKKKIRNNFKKYSFDIERIFATDLNTYETFFN